MACALQINPAVILRAATPGSDAIDDPLKSVRQPGQFVRPCDIGNQRLDASGFQLAFRHRVPAQTKNLMAETDEFLRQRQTDITAADNQTFHLNLRYAIYDLRTAQNYPDPVNRIS